MYVYMYCTCTYIHVMFWQSKCSKERLDRKVTAFYPGILWLWLSVEINSQFCRIFLEKEPSTIYCERIVNNIFIITLYKACMYVFIYLYKYMCMWIYLSEYMYMCLYECLYVYMYIYMYVYTCLYLCMYVCMYM